MKVLVVHDYAVPVGGAENVSRALRDGLRVRGHDARLFGSTARPLPLPVVADYTCFGTMSGARRLLQVANPWAAQGLRRVLAEYRPDVVHLRMFLTQLSPLILRELLCYPTVLHVVNYDLICPLNTKTLPDGSPCHHRAGRACRREGCLPLLGVVRQQVQTALRTRWEKAIDLVVTNSMWTRRRLEAEGITVHETVWNGVPVQPARPPLTSSPTVSFVGRLLPKKGVDVLLRAFVRIVEELPAARLQVLGDGPERAALERLGADLGVAGSVEFLGHRSREEIEGAVADAWVQAVPSRWEEPFGLVAAEAMMRGTAVVASESGGLGEQVRDVETGYTVPPGDPGALTVALLRILRDREQAEAMGRAGRARALAEFSEDRMVERFEQLYAQLLQREPPAPHPVQSGARLSDAPRRGNTPPWRSSP